MSDFLAQQDLTIAHFGVKGMRWGVRKDPDKAAAKAQRKVDKLDEKFEKLANNPDLHVRVWMDSVKSLKKSGDFKKILNKPEYSGSKFRLRAGVANRALQKKYEDEVASKLVEHIRSNARQFVNRSGTRRMDVLELERVDVQRASKNLWKLITVPIKHAGVAELDIRIVRDPFGRITDMIPVETSIAQSELFNDEHLAHFGIKGMKWGVRKKRPVSDEAQAKQDVKAAVKKNKVASVSNADLQSSIRRMQLEQDFKRLSVNEQSGVTRWLSSALLEIGKREVQRELTKRLSVRAIKTVAKASVGAPG